MSGIFNSAIFNRAVFNTGAITPSTATPYDARLSGGSPGGGIDPRYSSLTKTRDMPGIKSMIEADDERILLAVVEEFTKRNLQ